jgi:membrane protease YdiL (CAAX protease family)
MAAPPLRWRPVCAALLAQAGLLAWGLSAAMGLQALLVNLLLAPWLEEYLLRSGLQESLHRHRPTASPVPALLLCALVFAAAHVALRPDLWSACTVFPALLLGGVYARWRRLAPCALLHAFFNLLWLLPHPSLPL